MPEEIADPLQESAWANQQTMNQKTALQTLTPGQQYELAQSVTHDYRQWKQARSVLEDRWRECWEAYLCNVTTTYTQPDDYSADRSRVARPVLYEAVEAIHTNLLNGLFPGDEKFFTVMGKTEQDHANARLIEEFLKNKIDDMGFFEKYAQFLKQAIITGNTAAAIPWKRKTQKRRKTMPVTLLGIPVGTEKAVVETLVYNGPDFEVIDMFDFLLDPDQPEFAKAKLIRKVERSLDYLKQCPFYSNIDQLQAGWDDGSDNGNKLAKRTAFGISEGALQDSSSRKDRVVLLEAWGDFRIGETLYENYVCVVANDQTIIRFEENPYDHGEKPFIFTTFIPVPNEVYGIGAIEKSLGLQHAINTLTNQKLDVISISINNPFTYLVNDDVFDPDTIVTRPGALIPVKSHETLQPIQYLNNYTVAFEEINDLKTEVQEATGALKYFTGGDTQNGNDRTATEVNALVSGGNQKFSFFMSHLEHTSLEPFLQMSYENARQFIDTPETLRILHPDGSAVFLDLPPEVLQQSDCSFRVEGSRGLILEKQEITAITAFLNAVKSDPVIRQQINVLALYKKVYRRLGFTDEADIFLDETAGKPAQPSDVQVG